MSGKSSELDELSESELRGELFKATETCYNRRDELEESVSRVKKIKKELKEREEEDE